MLRSHVSFQNVLVLPRLADHHHTFASSTGEIVVGNIAIVLQGLLYQLLTQSVDFLNLYFLLFLKKERLKRQKIAKWSFYFEFQVVVAVVGFSWH